MITATSYRSSRLTHTLFYYGPLAVWLVFSLLLATALGSYNHTVSCLYWALTFLSPETVPPDVNHMYGLTHLARRGAYILEYAVFAFLLVRAVQGGASVLKSRSLLAVAGFGLFFALIDNGIRIATPGRHGGWDDIILSLSNVALSTGLIFLFFAVKAWERTCFARESDLEHGTVQ